MVRLGPCPWILLGPAVVACGGTVAACSGAIDDATAAATTTDVGEAYIDDVSFRRMVLERDLTERDNDYAAERLALYAREGSGWELLPERDFPSAPLFVADVARFERGLPLDVDRSAVTSIAPTGELPATDEAWIALGRRAFFEYPLRADPVYEALLHVPDGVARAGFLDEKGAIVGLRLFVDDDGSVRVGQTCAQCHASRLADPGGEPTPILSNRAMDVGAARLLVVGLTPGKLPPEIESTAVADLDRLGPGRADVLSDGIFNPFALPDLGALVAQPYLQHNANWRQSGPETLAVRCETLVITSNDAKSRPPRSLTWALAMYIRSLEPPPPADVDVDADEVRRGEVVFTEAGCSGCHTPPIMTSERRIPVDVIGTDPSAGLSWSRGTGYYRIPSLRGVGRAAPYLHHGAFDSLEEMFDPERTEPGHPFGLDRSVEERKALLAFLRSI